MPSTPSRAAIAVAAVLTAVTPVACSSGDAAPPRAPRTAGVAIPSGSDIRVPPRTLSAAKQGDAERPGAAGAPVGAEEGDRVPPSHVGTRTNTAFRADSKLSRTSQAEVKAKRRAPESSRPEGFTFSRFRRRSLRRCRSPLRPSAHEYEAPYPAPSPPGTRPRDESPWRSHRGPHRRTAP